MRQITLTPSEDGKIIGQVPTLPGCIAEGDNWHDAIENTFGAMEAYVKTLERDGLPVPSESFTLQEIDEAYWAAQFNNHPEVLEDMAKRALEWRDTSST